MHLLIPFAACNDPASRQLLRGLRLPQLEQLLARLSPLPLDTAADDAAALPHERVLARALGLNTDDPIPWAAWQAHSQGLDTTQAWAFITPCHWQVGQTQVTLDDPDALALQEDESRALLAAMQPYFEEDGITLTFESPARWLAQGEVFRALSTASLERVIGRDLGRWLPTVPALRRLQNEMQMLLYPHPVNEARSQRGAVPVNSFWISGSGALAHGAWTPDQVRGDRKALPGDRKALPGDRKALPSDRDTQAHHGGPVVDCHCGLDPQSMLALDEHLQHPTMEAGSKSGMTSSRHSCASPALRGPALRQDWAAWGQAWQQLDATQCAALLAALKQGASDVSLTLCGERASQTFTTAPRGLLRRFTGLFQRPSLPHLLEPL